MSHLLDNRNHMTNQLDLFLLVSEKKNNKKKYIEIKNEMINN